MYMLDLTSVELQYDKGVPSNYEFKALIDDANWRRELAIGTKHGLCREEQRSILVFEAKVKVMLPSALLLHVYNRPDNCGMAILQGDPIDT